MLDKKKILEWIDQASIDNYIPELQDTYGTEWIEKLKDEIISGRFDAPVKHANGEGDIKLKILTAIQIIMNEYPLTHDYAEDGRYTYPERWTALVNYITKEF